MKFNPLTQQMEDENAPPALPSPRGWDQSAATAFAEWEPYRPPWYPYDNDPWTIISNMSNNTITNYSAWCNSLAPGELARLIAEHNAARVAPPIESR